MSRSLEFLELLPPLFEKSTKQGGKSSVFKNPHKIFASGAKRCKNTKNRKNTKNQKKSQNLRSYVCRRVGAKMHTWVPCSVRAKMHTCVDVYTHPREGVNVRRFDAEILCFFGLPP